MQIYLIFSVFQEHGWAPLEYTIVCAFDNRELAEQWRRHNHIDDVEEYVIKETYLNSSLPPILNPVD